MNSIPDSTSNTNSEPFDPPKDDVDMVAAALGLRSSAWAQAIVHLVEPEFNADINGKPYLRNGKRVDDLAAARRADAEGGE